MEDLQRGDRQPWYHLLVDLRDWAAVSAEYAIAYVPEELLREPTPEELLPDEVRTCTFLSVSSPLQRSLTHQHHACCMHSRPVHASSLPPE